MAAHVAVLAPSPNPFLASQKFKKVQTFQGVPTNKRFFLTTKGFRELKKLAKTQAILSCIFWILQSHAVSCRCEGCGIGSIGGFPVDVP